jgi:integrase
MAKTSTGGQSLLDCTSFRFTPERLREACKVCAERGGRWVWKDEGCKHLEVRVGARGGVFYRYGRDATRSRVVRERIGEVFGPNAVPLEAARAKCDQLRVDPKAKALLPRRRIGSGGPTIKEAWDVYKSAITSGLFSMRRRRRPLKASTIAAYDDVFKSHLKQHETKSIHWLAANLRDLFETIGTKGSEKHGKPSPGAANKLLQISKNLFEFCRTRGEWDQPNPAISPHSGVTYQKFELTKREPRLTKAQTLRLLKAMKAKGPYWCDFFTVVALTGRRLSNVRELRWDAVDLDEGLIIDQPDDMKNGQPNHAPLAKTTLAVLRRMRAEAAPDAEWVFPGRKPGRPIINPDHAWNEIRTAAKLPTLRIHDLRHNAATWATHAGKSERAVGKFMAHKSATSTSRYQHADVTDARAAAEAVDETWCRFTSPSPGA